MSPIEVDDGTVEEEDENIIYAVCVVGFHHIRGPEVEYWVGVMAKINQSYGPTCPFKVYLMAVILMKKTFATFHCFMIPKIKLLLLLFLFAIKLEMSLKMHLIWQTSPLFWTKLQPSTQGN